MLKKLISISLAMVMAVGMGTVAFAEESTSKDEYSFEEFSAIIEEAFAEKGETVEVTGYDENIALTQELLEDWLYMIDNSSVPMPVNSDVTPELILIDEQRAGDFTSRTYTFTDILVTDGVPGYCDVKVTLKVLLFAGTGELYDVDNVTSRKSGGLFANSWTQTSYDASPTSSYRSVDVDVDGYVEWGYGGFTLTSEHTISHTFVIQK